SPMMTLVWHVVGFAAAGPAPMLILQSGLAVAGAYAIARRRFEPRIAAALAAVLVVVPPVLGVLGEVSPAAQLLGFALAGAAAVTSESRRYRVLGVALLVVAAGLPETGPAVAFVLAASISLPEWPAWRGRALALVIAVATVGTGRLVDRLLV